MEKGNDGREYGTRSAESKEASLDHSSEEDKQAHDALLLLRDDEDNRVSDGASEALAPAPAPASAPALSSSHSEWESTTDMARDETTNQRASFGSPHDREEEDDLPTGGSSARIVAQLRRELRNVQEERDKDLEDHLRAFEQES